MDRGRSEVIAMVRAYQGGDSVPHVLGFHSNPTIIQELLVEKSYVCEIAGLLSVILLLMGLMVSLQVPLVVL